MAHRFRSLAYSLRLRLILMFMLVVMVAVGTVALAASQITSNNLQIYTQAKTDQQLADQQIVSTLLAAYRQQKSQHYLQELTEQLARSSHQRIVLLDPQRRVIADSAHTLIGQILNEEQTGNTSLRTAEEKGNTPALSATLYVSVDSSTQSLSQSAVSFAANSPEAAFLASVNQALWLAVCIAGLIALLLALLFARALLKPLHLLKTVAIRMEQGDLSQRVSIKGKGEISELAHAFNAMADSLSRSEQARRNLVNDVAHELRNPLMNIRGYLELLVDGVLEPTAETLSSLYEETSLLSRLIADLQVLSLAEAGQLHLERHPVELADVVSQAVQIVQPQLEQKHLHLHLQLPPDLPPLEADPERLAQILRNLLRNAITHTASPGEIWITAHQRAKHVHISVRDSGTGIAPEYLPYIFERFYRADSSRTRATGGTGLGLAIVKQMVLAHGGQISVSSKPGEGTCFTFTLPIADAILTTS